MITKNQLDLLAKNYNINETTILREYLQLFFLQKLYGKKESKDIFFKGGTAIHLLYNAPRFSEDLDFTVMVSEDNFLSLIGKLFKEIEGSEEISFKEKKSIAGKNFLLTYSGDVLTNNVFISLDFSFREKVFEPEMSVVKTDMPIIFTSYINHLSRDEIFAEKIRAVMTRRKGRDVYDLWFLMAQGAVLKENLIKKKLSYYDMQKVSKNDILERVSGFSKKEFVLDMRPFVPVKERKGLDELYDYIVSFIESSF